MYNIRKERKIKVFGMGSGSYKIIDRLMHGKSLDTEFFIVDTNRFNLTQCENYIYIADKNIGEGGVTVNELYGGRAAENNSERLAAAIYGADLLFIVVGVGSTVGYGMAGVLASIARQLGITTVSVVVEPFDFEGEKRLKETRLWREKLKEYSNVIVLPTQKVIDLIGESKSYKEVVEYIDKTAVECISKISEIAVLPQVLNIDFDDLTSFLKGGQFYYGVGIGRGEERVLNAVESALNSPIQNVSFDGASRVIVFVEEGVKLDINDFQQAVERVKGVACDSANIIMSLGVDEQLNDGVRVCVFASGWGEED